MANVDISVIFSKLDLPAPHIEFLQKKLFKYKDDPVVAIVCNIINSNQSHISNLNEIMSVSLKGLSAPSTSHPLIMCTPNDPLKLRVYKNITVNAGFAGEEVTPTNTSAINDWLKVYETDLNDEVKKQQWTPLERAEKRLMAYEDMPTARAITRYLNTGWSDHQIRDFSARIDEYRKPMELLYAETPEQFLDMYGSGINSCMSLEGHEAFKFLIRDHGICPTSFFAYTGFTKGAYMKKNGSVIARAILYKHKDDKWFYGRVYAATTEYNNKFIQQLKEKGIYDGIGSHHPPPIGYSFKIPGYKKNNNVYAIPVPYTDNLPHNGWSATYDKDTHEFTITYRPKDKNKLSLSLAGRSGHVVSSNYITMECSNCGSMIIGKECLPVTDSDDVFCSDNCAFMNGFIKVRSSEEDMYQREITPEMISVVDTKMLRFTNLTAATRRDFHPYMKEIGIISEENNIKVIHPYSPWLKFINDSEGKPWGITIPDGIDAATTISRVPIKYKSPKTVVYDDNHQLIVENSTEIPF